MKCLYGLLAFVAITSLLPSTSIATEAEEPTYVTLIPTMVLCKSYESIVQQLDQFDDGDFSIIVNCGSVTAPVPGIAVEFYDYENGDGHGQLAKVETPIGTFFGIYEWEATVKPAGLQI